MQRIRKPIELKAENVVMPSQGVISEAYRCLVVEENRLVRELFDRGVELGEKYDEIKKFKEEKYKMIANLMELTVCNRELMQEKDKVQELESALMAANNKLARIEYRIRLGALLIGSAMLAYGFYAEFAFVVSSVRFLLSGAAMLIFEDFYVTAQNCVVIIMAVLLGRIGGQITSKGICAAEIEDGYRAT